MISAGSELRILGVAAALGGLLVMMGTVQPSVTSLSCGLVGLAVFGASRLVPRSRPASEPDPAAREPTILSSSADDAARGGEQDLRSAAKPSDLHAALQRTVRMKRAPGQATPSSLLPPSRALRSPSTT